MSEIVQMNSKVRLRKLNDEDLDFIITEQAKPENSQYIPQWTRRRHLASIKDTDFMYLIVETFPDSIPVGYAILSGIENSSKHIALREFVITQKRKGFGRSALILIKKLAFEELRAHRFRLEVWAHNPNAEALYKSEGFFEEGTVRDCVREDFRYLSYIIMSILESEYYA
jgi:diamine N-acetyltransferase